MAVRICFSLATPPGTGECPTLPRLWEGWMFCLLVLECWSCLVVYRVTQPPFNSTAGGSSPWTIDFRPAQVPGTPRADIAIVGAGFTGLAAAAWLRHLDPTKSVVVLESETIGAGASGRTGGMTLSETAAGDLPGLGDVGEGFERSVLALRIDCALAITGAWEIERSARKAEERAKTRGASQSSGRIPARPRNQRRSRRRHRSRNAR